MALKYLSATAAGVVASSEVLFAFLVAWLWLGEGLGPLQMVGAAIVLAGIVLAQTARVDKVVDANLAPQRQSGAVAGVVLAAQPTDVGGPA